MERIVLPDLAIASIDLPPNKDPDLVYMTFKLAHQGSNKNRDYFTAEVLRNSYMTAVHKAINKSHSSLSFGYINKSELAEEPDGRLYIMCGAYLWKYNYPEIVQDVLDRYKTGQLAMSMECWFDKYEFWVGDGEDKLVFAPDEAKANGVYSCWQNRKLYNGQPVYRVFKGSVIFGAAAVVANPADEDALILAVANKETNPVRFYHDLLHKCYEKELFTTLSKEEIIEEHRRLHEKFAKIL